MAKVTWIPFDSPEAEQLGGGKHLRVGSQDNFQMMDVAPPQEEPGWAPTEAQVEGARTSQLRLPPPSGPTKRPRRPSSSQERLSR